MAFGIIFANLNDNSIKELTAVRTQASVPFGCRYRLIDFPLSCMVNAGITNVSVITHYNYQSLVDHLGSGKDWDLARRTGGLRLVPPYIASFATHGAANNYDTRLEALFSICDTFMKMKDDTVVLADSDAIVNIDIADMLEQHEKSGADLTFAVKKLTLTGNESEKYNLYYSDYDGNLADIIMHPRHVEGDRDVSINIWVANRTFLLSAIQDAVAHGYDSMTKGIVARYLGRANMKVYHYNGVYACMSNLEDYYACNMALLSHKSMRESLFNVPNRPILTKIRNSAPTQYVEGCVAKNSMIADGCIIEGEVENCILFRGVKIGKGSVVKNSILFQDTQVGDNSTLNGVVADKNVVIREGVSLAGHPIKPFYIDKGKMI